MIELGYGPLLGAGIGLFNNRYWEDGSWMLDLGMVGINEVSHSGDAC